MSLLSLPSMHSMQKSLCLQAAWGRSQLRKPKAGLCSLSTHDQFAAPDVPV